MNNTIMDGLNSSLISNICPSIVIKKTTKNLTIPTNPLYDKNKIISIDKSLLGTYLSYRSYRKNIANIEP